MSFLGFEWLLRAAATKTQMTVWSFLKAIMVLCWVDSVVGKLSRVIVNSVCFWVDGGI